MIVTFNQKLSDLEKLELGEKLKGEGLNPYFLEEETGETILVTENNFPLSWLDEKLVDKAIEVDTPFQLAHRVFRPEGTIINVEGVEIGVDNLTVIAGPCAVESEEQLFETAEIVKKMGAHILRGGAFKPRTSPYSFQGLGEKGLEILARAGEKFGLPVVTEATSPEIAEIVAQYADIIQVGARNMQNFELLKKVGKLRKPVLLKRGLSSTIEDWLLAAEYILSWGNFQVILCERGIRTIETLTRNTLDLTAIPVVKDLSHLPVIVDPSHGTGLREKVIPMARAAVACGADGVMVEVHPHPEKALSDGRQSLYPEQFRKLMNDLEVISILVGKDLKKSDIPQRLEMKSKSEPLSLRVAFLGERGSFSYQVAHRTFGEKAELLPCSNFREIFEKVRRGEATHGLIPIENTITGSIHNNYDLLLEFSDLYVVGERFIRVSQHLGLYPGTERDEIQVLFAHPQGFAQCGRFLESLKEVRVINVGSTEEAARRAKEFGVGGASISSEEAIKKYNLELKEEEIEDNPRNFTRFLIISPYFEPSSQDDKVSCVFAVGNYPGALYEVLRAFAERKVNLLKLESRPRAGKPWEYLFYADWEGNLKEDVYQDLIKDLSAKTIFWRILGSYRNSWKKSGEEKEWKK